MQRSVTDIFPIVLSSFLEKTNETKCSDDNQDSHDDSYGNYGSRGIASRLEGSRGWQIDAFTRAKLTQTSIEIVRTTTYKVCDLGLATVLVGCEVACASVLAVDGTFLITICVPPTRRTSTDRRNSFNVIRHSDRVAISVTIAITV